MQRLATPVILVLIAPIVALAQWAYVAPPWDFDIHPKYRSKQPTAIPAEEWQTLASFDSAVRCEKAKVFAREIRRLSANDREHLLTVFAAADEEQARREATELNSKERALAKGIAERDPDLARDADLKALQWWSASKCVPLSKPGGR